MDATTLINQHLNVATIMDYYRFELTMSDKTFARGSCRIHGGDNPTAFVINMENGLWFCHTGGCGGGDVYTLVELIEGVDFKQAVQKVAFILGLDIDNLEIQQRKADYLKDIRDFIKFMKKRKKEPLKEIKLPVGRKVSKFRSFKRETIEKFGMFFLPEYKTVSKSDKEYTLHNRLVFPIKFKDKIVGMSMRRTKSNDYPKWSHQPPSIYTGNLIYNYDALIGQEGITIVEGIPDVWAFDEIGVPCGATYGAHITEEQYRLIIKTGAELTLCFDNDDAGVKATKKAIEMFRNKTRLYQIKLPRGNDPDDISREELEKLYANRIRIC